MTQNINQKLITLVILCLTAFPTPTQAQESPFPPVADSHNNWIILNQPTRQLIFRQADGKIFDTRLLTPSEYTALIEEWPEALSYLGITISDPSIFAHSSLFAEMNHWPSNFSIQFGGFYNPLPINGSHLLSNQVITTWMSLSVSETLTIGPQVIIEPGGQLFGSAGEHIYVKGGFHAKPGSGVKLGR